MPFNLQKYLIQNNLTLRAVRALREEDSDEEEEPSKEDLKSTETDMRQLDKDKQQLKMLQAKVKDIIFKFTKDTPKGKVLSDVTAYKKAIGTLPAKVKELQNKIKNIENPSTEENEGN
jgi:hypothetical protein